MSRKIIGITVGTQLPKPNFKQNDPTKGDYIKNKPDFEGLQSKVDDIKELVGDTAVSEQISTAIANKIDTPESATVGQVLSVKTVDENGVITWETINLEDNVANPVRYDVVQDLTDEQKELARSNIGATSIDDIYKTEAVTVEATWDGNTENRDVFTLNINNSQLSYYKVSEDIPVRDLITGTVSVNSDGSSYADNAFIEGDGCYGIGSAIIITRAGLCNIYFDEYWNDGFTAPSTGIYFPSGAKYLTSLQLLTRDYYGIYLTSLSGNDFTVGVTDNGVIKTESADGTVVEMATNESVANLNILVGDSPVSEQIAEAIVTKISSPTSAKVGQVLSVKSIDENGNIIWEAINPEVADGSVVTDPTLSIEGDAADAKVTGDRLSIIESQIADLLYKEITITSFKNNGNTTTNVEKGATVANVTLTWETSKPPKTLTLDGNSIDTSLTDATFNNITSNRTWTLKATDERDAVAIKTTKISFVNGVYYGVVDSGITVNSSVIHNLVEQNQLTKSLQSTKAATFTATANNGQHIMYTLPTSYGTPMFKDKDTGFEAGFYKANTITFTNSNDYEESYDIWLSTNTGLGLMNVVVS